MFISLGSNKIFICFFFYKLQFLLPLQFQTHTTLPAINPYDFHHLFLEIFELPLNYAPAFLQLYFSEFPVFYTKQSDLHFRYLILLRSSVLLHHKAFRILQLIFQPT